MSTLLLVFNKFYTVDKMVLRAVGLSFQQLPCLPFGTLGSHEYMRMEVQPAPLGISSLHLAWGLQHSWAGPWKGIPRMVNIARECTRRCVQVWLHEPRTKRAGRGNEECAYISEPERIYFPAFPIACFLSGENPFWQPRRWASNSCLQLIFHFNPSVNGF